MRGLEGAKQNELPTQRRDYALRSPSLLPQRWLSNEGANTMIMERGARPDALPKPKRRRTALAGVVGVGVSLALALGLGVGLGPGIKRYLSTLTPHPSLCCTGQHVGQRN
jgi:hypothetical protein